MASNIVNVTPNIFCSIVLEFLCVHVKNILQLTTCSSDTIMYIATAAYGKTRSLPVKTSVGKKVQNVLNCLTRLSDLKTNTINP
jgi:hypothetical protein